MRQEMATYQALLCVLAACYAVGSGTGSVFTLPPTDAKLQNIGNVNFRTISGQVQLTEAESEFFVCPPPTGATVVRLEPPRPCPDFNKGKNYTEGIGIIFKENIAPYKFKATLYYKNVITTTTWSGTTYRQITNRYADRVPVDIAEITELIDKNGKCLSKAAYFRNNVKVEAFDRDEGVKELPLVASRFSTRDSRAWHTTNDTYTAFGTPWVYRTGTSVNCIVEEVQARSVYPYDFFGLSTGDVVEMSPFFGFDGDSANERMGYSLERFRQFDGYLTYDIDSRRRATQKVTRNFLTNTEYTVTWDWATKKSRVCSLKKWQEADEFLRAQYGNTFRFSSKSLSATFISNVTEFDLKTVKLSQCADKEASEAIDRIFKTKYKNTHKKVGNPQTYLAVGGFVIIYQPIISNSLAAMYIEEMIKNNDTDKVLYSYRHHRTRRNAGNGGGDNSTVITTTSNVQFAMLQFTYDHIQNYVNDMFGRIAVAWCELQNRESVLWREMRKLNPSAIASTTLGRRVSARMLGDVIAVSSCVKVDATKISLQNSMKMVANPTTCYSRPLVTFKLNNDSSSAINGIEGQLGENNELLLSRNLVEPCTANNKRYFMFGSSYVYYENYQFIKRVDPADIQMVSTFIDLNLTMMEDREIAPLEVYTRKEILDTGVLDFMQVQRRSQLHEMMFYDIDKVVNVDNNMAFMSGLSNFFQGLGQAGQAIGKVVVGAAGAIVSTVAGVASFLSNPFGALTIGLIVVAGLVAAFLAYRYISKLRANPMKALYPITTKGIKDSVTGNGRGGDGELPNPEEFDEEKLNQAREMVQYLAYLSGVERMQKKARRRGRTSLALSSALLGMMTNKGKRRAGVDNPAYEELDNEYSDDGDI